MLRDNRKNESNWAPDANLEPEFEGLEPIHRRVLKLFLEHKDGLTVQEISEIGLKIDTETLNRCLSELHRKRLIYAVDEQREDGIWKKRYFLRSEISRAKDTGQRGGFQCICPVCGRLLGDQNLPDIEGVIKDEIFHLDENNRIVNSRVTIEHEFDHFYNEEENKEMNEPHSLISIIETEFDEKGACIRFDILEIRPAG
jgi:predicted transcriptional regulator